MNDYHRIARVIAYLDEHQLEQPSLAQLAEQAGLSQHHFHRLFTRWAGVTPKGFLQCLTLARARQALEAGESVLQAAFGAGLSGPGRLHDLCVNLQAASPGEVKSGGAGWTIRAGFAESPFGTCCVGESPRGICHLAFSSTANRAAAEGEIRRDWPQARVTWSAAAAQEVVESMFAEPDDKKQTLPLRAIVRGTEFQLRVWRALLQIPRGQLTSYGRIAASLGDRAAARAVGSAVGQNRLAYLIPCHRVIRETGVLGEYRWGRTRKRALVAWESARQAFIRH